MTNYVATFYTELSALLTHKKFKAAGIDSRRAPVPRALSASCGISLFYAAEQPHFELMDVDCEGVYAELPEGKYEKLR